MTITIEAAPGREPYLVRQAERSSLTLDQFASRVLGQTADAEVSTSAGSNLGQASVAERIARFRRWTESHGRETPLLTDEEISREALYGGRDA